ncbi:MAG: gluconate 2-dehydrogenase subunit 3 family protein, partial [Marinirhabdus sp.]
MNRRQVLKNLGYGAGFLVATPTVMSLLQSCKNEPEFNPVFLSKTEGHALRRTVGLIVPEGKNVPGAVAIGAHTFIDAYWNEVIPQQQQQQIRVGFKKLSEKFQLFTQLSTWVS